MTGSRPASTRRGEDLAVISGVGISEVARPSTRPALALTVDAVLAAIADAGLDPEQIDGVSTYPGLMGDPPGMSPIGVQALKEALRLRLDWFSGGSEVPGQLGAVVNAVAAVSAGLARHVVCFRTVHEASAMTAKRHAEVGEGFRTTFEWQLPFRAYSAANWVALQAQRHMHEHGTTREHLAAVAVTQREHAARNPHAVFRSPLTVEEHLDARMISTPFGLYDCDVPVDASVAIVVSASDAVGDLRRGPVRIRAVGTALHDRDSWDQRADLTTMAAHDAAAMLWSRTSLTPRDVDVAQVYDGFSFHVLSWLEALGFCEPGRSGPFVADGATRLDGSLPTNTQGGQLSAGRLHGFGFLWEACLQLWGEAGDRQVPGAEVAVAAAGGGPLGSALLLST